MGISTKKSKRHHRRAAVMVLATILVVVMLAFLAFAVDLGYIALTRTQMQNAADAAALAGVAYAPRYVTTPDKYGNTVETIVKKFANLQTVAGKMISDQSISLEYGTWDVATRTFNSGPPGNAIRVTIMRDGSHDEQVALFFAPILGKQGFDSKASAVAMTNPRDICFVVDLSGSMNNDTEPGYTNSINSDYPGVGTTMMQNVFNDFGYGSYPGNSQNLGHPLTSSWNTLASSSNSPLLDYKQPLTITYNGNQYTYTVPSQYQISTTKKGHQYTVNDSQSTINRKAYSWVMDVQIPGDSNYAFLPGSMPAAKPAPNSSDTNNYNYWYAYLNTYRNSEIGYSSYVQWMMDWGRTKPTSSSTLYSPLSVSSPDCPYNPDTTILGNTFNFPPREMPTHASRMAIIDALKIIKDRNQEVTDPNERDWVSIVTFDLTSNVAVLHSLDYNYDGAMQDCTTMQACQDNVACTSTETGLMAAINHLTANGRPAANKVVVLLTDGVPNLYSSSSSEISNYINNNPNSNYYNSGSKCPQDAAMMQAAIMQGNKWMFFPVELGLEGNTDFMNRIYNVSIGETTQTSTSDYKYSKTSLIISYPIPRRGSCNEMII
jgi:Flp pilus assembly protein TadG